MSKPTKYRKKPIVIEAFLFDGTNDCAIKIEEWSSGRAKRSKPHKDYDYGLMDIETKEGTMTANTGEYIVKGIQGEFYPCKPDIFEETYEEAWHTCLR